MKKSVQKLGIFGFAAIFGLSVGAPALAQEESETFDFGSVAGIQTAIGREYEADLSGLMDAAATPGAEMEMPDGILYLNTIIFQFDSDDNADAGLDVIYDESIKAGTESAGDTAEITEDEPDDIGDEAKSFSLADPDGADTGTAYGIYLRDDSRVIMIIGTGGEAEATTEGINDIAKAMSDRDPGEGEGTLNEDGTSTGGNWDIFLVAGDKELQGLTPSRDGVVYPRATS